MQKVKSLPELEKQIDFWRTERLSVGFTCGAFDLLHAGHADYLQRARKLCDRLVVAVNSDDSVRSYKSPFRPIVAEQHRMSLVAALECVDAVTLMTDRRPAVLLELLHPDMYIKGGDYSVDQLKSAPLVASYGGRSAVIPVEHEVSSSAIIKRIEQLAQYSLPEQARKPLHGPLVLLDRDGTMIENVHFLNNPRGVKLLDGVGPGLKRLQDAGLSLAVITNQQGIGLGYFDYDTFVAINSEMLRLLSPYGIQIARFYFCPHSLAEDCPCRKPGTKLIERALLDFSCSASDCFLVGDAQSDMAAAKAAGCRGILVRGSSPTESAKSFSEAVEQILTAQTVTT